MRSSLQILWVAGVFCLISTIARSDSQIVIAIRYLQAQGTAFLTFTENRYIPIPASKKTANCSYIERWDEKLNHIWLRAREICRDLLRHVNVSARSDAGRDHLASKLGVKTESLQARESGKRCEDASHSKSASREIHRDCFLSRKLLECVPVLASLLLLTSLSAAVQAQPDSLEQLANDFWAWRAKYAPFTSDDVNRIERPGGMRNWSRASIDQRRKDLVGFEARWKKLNPAQWPISKQVDYKLIGSALSRVRWELEVNPRWKRDPNFYIEQTLTALAEALTIPAPYDEARSREILTRIENIPSILQQGLENLENPPAPFASVAVQNLDGIREQLYKMAGALVASTNLKRDELNAATDRAADALEKFQQHLKDKLPKLPQQTALGRDAYIWLLAQRSADAVHAGGTSGHGTTGMEPSGRV